MSPGPRRSSARPARSSSASRLRPSGAISEEEYTQKQATSESSTAALRQARAALDSARLDLSFTKFHAPISGRISRTLVTVGNLVGSNEPTLLTTILRVDPVYVFFDVPERNFLEYGERVRQGKAATAAEGTVPVLVVLENEKDHPHRGTINFRENRADEGTGTIRLRGELPNPDRSLVPGLFARVRVLIGSPHQRLLVPEVALNADQRGTYVLTVKDDTVVYRAVKVGTNDEGLVVIEEGRKPDDRVIVNGIQRARPGAKVAAKEGAPAGSRGAKPGESGNGSASRDPRGADIKPPNRPRD